MDGGSLTAFLDLGACKPRVDEEVGHASCGGDMVRRIYGRKEEGKGRERKGREEREGEKGKEGKERKGKDGVPPTDVVVEP